MGRRDGDGPTNAREWTLRIRLVGAAVEDGTIGFRELAELAGNLQSGIERVARLLSGRDARSARRPPRDIASACSLRLAAVERGSVVLVARRPSYGQLSFEEMDIGATAIERFVEGLRELASDSSELPEGYDTGVLERKSASKRGEQPGYGPPAACPDPNMNIGWADRMVEEGRASAASWRRS